MNFFQMKAKPYFENNTKTFIDVLKIGPKFVKIENFSSSQKEYYFCLRFFLPKSMTKIAVSNIFS